MNTENIKCNTITGVFLSIPSVMILDLNNSSQTFGPRVKNLDQIKMISSRYMTQ